MKSNIISLVSCGLFVLINSAFAQTLTFTNLTYNRGTSAFYQTPTVALSDVSADNRLDLICANFFASTLSVLTNNGSGRFILKTTVPTDPGPSLVVAADVNNDAKMDLVSANSTTLTVLTNNGTGSFSYLSTVSLPEHHNQTAFVAADLNGDGKTDLITGNVPDGVVTDATVTVFTNDGAGHFTLSATLMLYPATAPPIVVDVADINSDGKPDLVCLDLVNIPHRGVLMLYTNNGTGVFTAIPELSVSPSAAAFASADVNGDGKVDLMVPDAASNLLGVWTNNGVGTFGAHGTCPIGTGVSAGDAKVADMNGDGKPDVLVTRDGTCPGDGPPCSNGTVLILTNNGTGTFTVGWSITAGVWTGQVVPGEVNGDGKMDFVCVNLGYNGYGNNTVQEFFNTATFSRPNMKFSSSGSSLVLTWPAHAGNFALQSNTNLSTTNWGSYGGVIYDNGITKSITNAPSAGNLFFRLKQ